MSPFDYFTDIFPRTIKYRLSRKRYKYVNPLVLTFTVTAACQSRCKTCQIGNLWLENPSRSKDDLTIEEIEKFFASIGSVYYFNVSGGEPYIRKDFPEIIELACKYLKPKVIVIPTNAIMSNRVYEQTSRILQIVERYNPKIVISVHPSIDGIGDKHDEIRGLKGNFEKLVKTISLLKPLEEKHKNFTIEPGTVVSIYNVDHIGEVEDFVHSQGLAGHRNEIAGQRSEFFNIGDPITPSADVYQKLMKQWAKKTEDNIKGKPISTKIAEAMRLVYCEIAGKILTAKRRIIPCYAGIIHLQVNYNGGVWGCCVLGYNHEFGNLRDFDFDLPNLMCSQKALEEQMYIQSEQCSCTLAGVIAPSMLCHFTSLIKCGIKFLKFAFRG